MSSEITIQAEVRSIQTKSALKKLRTSGIVPAVVYGRKGTQAIQVVAKALPKSHTKTQLLKLDVAGASKTVIMREVQVGALSDLPEHIDFQEVAADEIISAHVPLEFVGLTREQEKEGSFKILLRSLKVKGAAGKLPTTLKVNVGNLKVDESAHITDVEIPSELKVTAQKNLALASLVKL
jgi:large subunit ribosomal protein L25